MSYAIPELGVALHVILSEPQYRFLTSDAPVALFSAGIGCLHESTLVDTWTGPKPFAECKGQFTSFDGQFLQQTLGSEPFPKGKGMLHRVIHEHGELLAHESHLFFCSDHVYRHAHQAEAFLRSNHGDSFDRLLSNLDICQRELRKGDGRWFEIAVNCLDHYLAYCRQYGLRLHDELNSVRSLLPLLGDALEFVRSCDLSAYDNLDDQEVRAQAHIHLDQSHDHPSKMDSARHMAGQLSSVANLLSALIVERIWQYSRSTLQSDSLISRHHTIAVLHLGRTLIYALARPYASSRILSVEKATTDWYWDCQVPGLNNYTGSGLIHHNSGKSFVGANWAKDMLALEPYAKGFIAANTWRQLNSATLATFFQVLDQFGIPHKYNQGRGLLNVAGRTIYCYSLENYDAIRGIEIGWAWLDETRDTSKAAFDVVLGRLRDKNCQRRRIRLTSSPNGFDWLYDDFAGPEKKPSYEVIYGRTLDNMFLPEGYAESLKESYDEKAYRQEVLGEFVDLTRGAIYWPFKRLEHVKKLERNPAFPVRIGADYNVNPLTAVACQAYNDQIFVLKEYYIMGSNTHELSQMIVDDWGAGTEVIPDATGKALKTASRGLSDHQIMRDHGLIVLTNRNPPRMDRYNAVNGLLSHNRLWIDESCRHLITDFAKLVYREGTNQPDTNNPNVGHISDALGYLVYYIYPPLRVSSGVYQIK